MNDSQEIILSNKNSVDMNQYVIDRLSLLEAQVNTSQEKVNTLQAQVHTLQEELKESKSELKSKSNSKSNPVEKSQGQTQSVSFADESDNTEFTNRSYDPFLDNHNHHNYHPQDNGEIYDETDRRDKRDKDEEGVSDVTSEDNINMNERQPKSFKWQNSIMTRRINADDDFKVNKENKKVNV
jgi:hypothetical protein